jgi:hypothetical protein
MALLGTAISSDACKNGASSLACAMRQQLQQSGLLVQHAWTMLKVAEAVSSYAAKLAVSPVSPSEHTAIAQDMSMYSGMYPFTQCLLNIEGHMRLLWVSDAAWLADPSAHATAALHLLSAIQQYTSGMLQHVLPRLFKSGSRAADKLMHTLQEQTATVHAITATLTDAIYHAALTDTSTSGALRPAAAAADAVAALYGVCCGRPCFEGLPGADLFGAVSGRWAAARSSWQPQQQQQWDGG